MNILKIKTIPIVSVLFFSSQALCATPEYCLSPDRCESLGYTKSEDECPDPENRLLCPFSESDYYCQSFSSSEKCEVSGNIAFSDKTCSEGLVKGKTPVGVVLASHVIMSKWGQMSDSVQDLCGYGVAKTLDDGTKPHFPSKESYIWRRL